MNHTRKKSNGRKKHMFLLPIFLVAVVALILGATAPEVWADDPVCWWNIEFNASDGDVGVRGFFDYEPWKELEIENPRGRTFVEVEAENRKMRRQGLAEWFFESGEPTLLEVSFETFLRRFRTGLWEFEAEPIEGGEVECEELLTHVIPCAPEIDVEQDTEGVITITWEPVEEVVDTEATDAAVAAAGPDEWDAELFLECGGPAPDIIGYEVIVEDEDENIYKIDMPGTARRVSVPTEFTDEGGCFQYEVLAIEESGNQTITEEEFFINDVGDLEEECPEDD